MFGRRRKTALTDDLIFSEGILTSRGISRCSAAPIAKLARLGEPQFSRWRYAEPDTASRKPELDTWELPFSVAPKRFQKTALTDEELERELARSPLYDALRQRTLSPLKRPPLSLNKGHTSLLLMTGMLDGYVPSSPPHVVRGLTSKVEKLHRTESYETPSRRCRHEAGVLGIARSRSSGPSGPTGSSAPSPTRSATRTLRSKTKNQNWRKNERTRNGPRVRVHPGLARTSRSPRPRPSGRSSRTTPSGSAAASIASSSIRPRRARSDCMIATRAAS